MLIIFIERQISDLLISEQIAHENVIRIEEAGSHSIK